MSLKDYIKTVGKALAGKPASNMVEFKASGYDGAFDSRRRNAQAFDRSLPGDEDRTIGPTDRDRLRLECRDLRRNMAVVAGICERFADNVVGGGIYPQAKSSDPEWNTEAERYFREWAKVCDYRQRASLWQMQRLIVQASLTDGESFLVLLENGQLQPVEAERIKTPFKFVGSETITDGIKVSSGGIPIEYYICERNGYGSVNTDKYEAVQREYIKHVTRSFRFDQIRGIPRLAPVINSLRDFSEFVEDTMLKAKLEAKPFATVETDGSSGPGNIGPRNVSQGTTYTGQQIERIEAGFIKYMRKGEKFNAFKPETPNATFDAFTEKLLRLIGCALGLPYEFVLLDFSQGSFSSSRAALLQTYRTFQNDQLWLIESFLQPIWNWRIAKAIKAGDLPAAPVDKRGVSEWYKVRWQTPEFGWVDPQNEAQANMLEVNAGASSLTQWVGKKGQDAEEVLREKGNDIAAAIRVANEINAANGTAITWRDLITLGIPGQVTKGQVKEQSQTKEAKP